MRIILPWLFIFLYSTKSYTQESILTTTTVQEELINLEVGESMETHPMDSRVTMEDAYRALNQQYTIDTIYSLPLDQYQHDYVYLKFLDGASYEHNKISVDSIQVVIKYPKTIEASR